MSVFPLKRMHTPVSPQKRVHFRCYLVLGTGEHTQHSISVFRFIPLLLRSPARPLDVSFVVVVVVVGVGGGGGRMYRSLSHRSVSHSPSYGNSIFN